MTKLYTAEEVARHNQENDLWIVIHGGVYDLTNFLKEHPGGEEVLVQLAGQDGTQCFDDIGHSGEAIQLRDTFKIGQISGDLASTTKPSTSKSAEDGAQGATTVDDDNWEYHPPKYERSLWLPVFVSAGVAIYAFIFYYMFFT